MGNRKGDQKTGQQGSRVNKEDTKGEATVTPEAGDGRPRGKGRWGHRTWTSEPEDKQEVLQLGEQRSRPSLTEDPEPGHPTVPQARRTQEDYGHHCPNAAETNLQPRILPDYPQSLGRRKTTGGQMLRGARSQKPRGTRCHIRTRTQGQERGSRKERRGEKRHEEAARTEAKWRGQKAPEGPLQEGAMDRIPDARKRLQGSRERPPSRHKERAEHRALGEGEAGEEGARSAAPRDTGLATAGQPQEDAEESSPGAEGGRAPSRPAPQSVDVSRPSRR